ncbi:MAG: hypothetical protein HWE16_19070 [Gammaproteobacteria bacterium]|nr:hypothetical protein [Gammaproteobacteria bacterium]
MKTIITITLITLFYAGTLAANEVSVWIRGEPITALDKYQFQSEIKDIKNPNTTIINNGMIYHYFDVSIFKNKITHEKSLREFVKEQLPKFKSLGVVTDNDAANEPVYSLIADNILTVCYQMSFDGGDFFYSKGIDPYFEWQDEDEDNAEDLHHIKLMELVFNECK